MYVDKQVEREYIMREACRLDNLFVSKRSPQNQHNISIDKNVWRPNGIHLPMIFRPLFFDIFKFAISDFRWEFVNSSISFALYTMCLWWMCFYMYKCAALFLWVNTHLSYPIFWGEDHWWNLWETYHTLLLMISWTLVDEQRCISGQNWCNSSPPSAAYMRQHWFK